MSGTLSPQLTQQQVKVWDLLAPISGPLEGKLNDWPDNVQEVVYKMVEAKSKQMELPLAVVDSACIIDYGEAEDGSEDRWMIQVVVSEVVAKDVGYEKRVLDSQIKLMKMMETKH